MATNGAILDLDANGKVLRVLQSTKFGDISKVLDDDGVLFMGRFLHEGIVKFSVDSFKLILLPER